MRRARAAIIFAAFLAAGNASDEPLSIKLGLE